MKTVRLGVCGFTLIELLIVVAIIAVLAAIAVPNFLEAQTRSKVSRAKADLNTVARCMEAYRIDYNKVVIDAATKDSGAIEYLRWRDFRGTEKGIGWRLTTPIAYLTTIPYDYFNTRIYKTRQPHATNYQVLEASFFYRGRSYNRKAGVWHGGALGFPRSEKEGAKGVITPCDYIISTCGPDLLPWPSDANPRNWYQDMEYDPTNGSVSRGDIWVTDTMGLKGGGGR